MTTILTTDVKYPDDLPSKSMMAEFEASRLELRKTGDIYSEVLRQMATQHLDRDMAVIKVKGLQSLAEDMPLRMDDLYKLLNKSFWVGTVGADGSARANVGSYQVPVSPSGIL